MSTKGEMRKPKAAVRAKSRPRVSSDWHVSKAYKSNGHGDCAVCKGRCCTYVVLEMPKPRRKVDVDEIRWLLAHENIEVYIEEGTWHVLFYTPCRHLTEAGLCAIYEDRFEVCRDHDPETCEMSRALPEDITFTTTAEFDRWWTKNRMKPALSRSST